MFVLLLQSFKLCLYEAVLCLQCLYLLLGPAELGTELKTGLSVL